MQKKGGDGPTGKRDYEEGRAALGIQSYNRGMKRENLNLITVIVQHKAERKVIDAMLAAGAPGITYYYGRGTGVREKMGWLGHFIEAEKVVIVTVVPEDKTEPIVDAAETAAELDKPGRGFLVVHKAEYAKGFSEAGQALG